MRNTGIQRKLFIAVIVALLTVSFGSTTFAEGPSDTGSGKGDCDQIYLHEHLKDGSCQDVEAFTVAYQIGIGNGDCQRLRDDSCQDVEAFTVAYQIGIGNGDCQQLRDCSCNLA